MLELIKLLNETSALRVIFYSIVFLFGLGISFDGIREIINLFLKK